MKRVEINDFLIEKYIHGGLPLLQKLQMKLYIATDSSLKEEIAKRKAEESEFKLKYPAKKMASLIKEKCRETVPESRAITHRKRHNNLFKHLKIAVPALAFCIVLVFVTLPEMQKQLPEGNILKGSGAPSSPSLIVHRKLASGFEVLKSGTSAKAGDLLQIALNSDSERYGVILSIDGNGTVSVHYPFRSDESTSIAKGRTLLPRSVELDDAPYFERFILITHKSAIDLPKIISAAKRSTNKIKNGEAVLLDLPSEYQQFYFDIIKEN